MTSNLGSEYILEDEKNAKEKVLAELKLSFRPEFINRIDEIIVFHSLKKEDVGAILDKILHEISKRLEVNQIHIEMTKEAREKIVDESFDPKYGARPIKRYVTKNIETLIAHEIVGSDIKVGTTLLIDVSNDQFILKRK